MKYSKFLTFFLPLVSFCKDPAPVVEKKFLNLMRCNVGETCYVNSYEGLNIREKPALAAKRVQVVPYGAGLIIEAIDPIGFEVNSQQGQFVKVKWKETRGWVFDGFLVREKPEDIDSYYAYSKTQAEVDKIREMTPGPEKEDSISSLRGAITGNSNLRKNPGLRFELCTLNLEDKLCANDELQYFKGSQREFFTATIKAIQSGDAAFLYKYSQCIVHFSCYGCDWLAATHKNKIIEFLLPQSKKVNWREYEALEHKLKSNRKGYVYRFKQSGGNEALVEYFVLGIARHKSGWFIQRLGGGIMHDMKPGKPETCSESG